MAELEMDRQRRQEIGAMIRAFRLTKVQIHNGNPWTQDDLAVAIGGDKAHVSRIEQGKHIPSPQTLEKICAALGLTWEQRRGLMIKAGYLTALPSPSGGETQRVIDELHPHLDQLQHPAVLHDREAIMWDLNALEAYTFYGYESREKFLEDCQGLRVIELLMTPSFSSWFQKVIVDYESYVRRQILRFMELYIHHPYHEEYASIKNRLCAIPEYRGIWQELMEHQECRARVPFLNHQIMKIRHPELGMYQIQIWHCDVSFDERFTVVQHVANDPDTQQMFQELWKRFHTGSGR